VSEQPGNVETLLADGCAALERGDAQQAFTHFQSVLAFDAANADALCGRGLSRLRLQQEAAGKEDLHKAAALGSTAAHYFLGAPTPSPKRPWWRYLLAVLACLAVFFICGFIQVVVLHKPQKYVSIIGLGILTAIYLTWKFVLHFKLEGASRPGRYVGVGGWLILFYISTVSEAIIMTYTAMRFPKLGVALFVSLLSIWGIATCALLILKKRHCVTNAKIYILVMTVVYFIGFMFSNASIDFILCKTYVNALWMLYFFFSKRVRDTYTLPEALP
jgi:hypothetical protein